MVKFILILYFNFNLNIFYHFILKKLKSVVQILQDNEMELNENLPLLF